MSEIYRGHLEAEGDTLYYEARGKGEPILFIPPAGGDGDMFLAVADILSREYRVITYDRRANSRSTMNEPQNFEISQQSRDAAAIIKAAGEESAHVFGNSSGAIIALDMAKTQPKSVRTIIVHEAPAARVHPKSLKWQRFFARVYKTSFTLGPEIASLRFIMGIQVHASMLIKAHAKGSEYAKETRAAYNGERINPKAYAAFLMRQELLPVTNYLPDFEKIMKNGVKVFIGAGEWGLKKKTWLAVISKILSEKLECELAFFPGHHGSYMDMPEEFAEVIRGILKKA